MKYESEIIINLPRNKVIELFDNPDNLRKWMIGLKSFEHVSGEPGKPGAKSKLVFDMNGRNIEMTETITVRNLPEEFSGTYETKGALNVQENFFYELPDGTTRWKTVSEFRLTGFMKVMGWFMPGAFKKETMKHLKSFKEFAEKDSN